MKTKRNFITAILLVLFAVQGFSDDGKKLNAALKDVTVFFEGAELTHTLSAELAKGENEITIENLSPILNRNSLQIKISDGVVVSSFEYSVNYLIDEKQNIITKKLQDSIDLYTEELNKINEYISINENMLEFLEKGINHNLTVEKKQIAVEELDKNIQLFKTKTLECNEAITKSKKNKTAINEKVSRLRQQLNQEKTKHGKNEGILKLKLASPLAANAKFTIKYFTSSASWTPFYDINIVSADNPINIITKSKVSQTTGIDWNKVNLTLSTVMPSNGKDAPIFNAWFLREQITTVSKMLQGQVPGLAVQNSISYAEGAPGAANEIKIRGIGSAQDSQKPLYVLNGYPIDENEFSSIDQNQIASISILKDASATALYGSRAASGVVVITTKSIEDYILKDENHLSRTFSIDMPYTIESNGKEQVIEIEKQIAANVAYRYYCAPKLDIETYLIAEISEWEKLNLMSGQANITYDGTYIGQTEINASSTNKKLTLTLGTDKRVSVKREKMQDYSSVKFLGTDTKVLLTYKITVRNNQNKSVSMILKDQYPLSTNKNITVELLEKTTKPTTNREDIGIITWEEQLQAGETKEYFISFSAKYPKNMNLNL
ncbi:MAG: DUF4139 domain-containing protein [Prevotellaceae bacterium]|nr:DUF4139 domain-containing protein [Prevotellaceae bacterium]